LGRKQATRVASSCEDDKRRGKRFSSPLYLFKGDGRITFAQRFKSTHLDREKRGKRERRGGMLKKGGKKKRKGDWSEPMASKHGEKKDS